MSQTSYSQDMSPVAFEGQLADSGFTDKKSIPCAAAMPFGKLVVRDTADLTGKLPAAETDVTNKKKVLGLSISTQALPQDPSVANPQYPTKSVVPVLSKGRAWVKVEGNVTPDSDVYVRYAAGGNGPGSFSGALVSDATAVVAGARYLTTALANNFALLEADF